METKEFKLIWNSEVNDKICKAYFNDIQSLKELAYELGDECISYLAYERRNNRWRSVVA